VRNAIAEGLPRVRGDRVTATSGAELNRQRHSGHEWYWEGARELQISIDAVRRRWRARRGAGHRPGLKPTTSRVCSAILHDKPEAWAWAFLSALDHRSQRGTAVAPMRPAGALFQFTIRH